MTHLLAWLPVLACGAMMFAGGAVAWLAARTPLGRVSWLARRTGQLKARPRASTTAPPLERR
jgi:hypothetical protein